MATQPQPLTPRTLEEFRRRRRLLDDLRFDEARARLSGFLDWIESEPSVKEIVETIERSVPAANLLEGTNRRFWSLVAPDLLRQRQKRRLG